MVEITPAVPKLKAFVAAHFGTKHAAAAELRETQSSFTAWFSGAQRPGFAKARKLRAWTGGRVKEDDWLTKEERAEIKRLERVAARRTATEAVK